MVVYLDYILVTGPDQTQHLKSLKKVLCRLQNAGLKLKKEDCHFMQPSGKYLGFCIDSKGLHSTEDKLQAIQKASGPTKVTALKSYLGILAYYIVDFCITFQLCWPHYFNCYIKVLRGLEGLKRNKDLHQN